MLKIAVCFKYVLDEVDIKVDVATRTLKKERVAMKISDYDRNAIEEGVLRACEAGGTVTAISAGSETIRKGFKDALSRGADNGVFICDDTLADASAAESARVLSKAIEKGAYDLIIFGEGSSDMFCQQVGPRVAELLGYPVISYVNKLSVKDEYIKAERKLEDGIEIVSCKLPAVVTVSSDINTLRIPGMKQILAAKKKPLEELCLSDIDISREEILSYKTDSKEIATVMDRKKILYSGSDAVTNLVNCLMSQGVI